MLVQARIRTNGTVARVGGDEFAVILPEVRLDHGRAVAEKLRGLVAAEVVSHKDSPISVTISFGVTEWTSDSASAKELLQHADERLREAKAASRNCVR